MDFTSIAATLKQKPMDDRELQRSIRIAVAAEHDASHLYELIADSTNNKKAKDLLQDIANEEKVHIGELEQLLTILDKNNNTLVEKGKREAMDKTSSLVKEAFVDELNKIAIAMKEMPKPVIKKAIPEAAAKLLEAAKKKPGAMSSIKIKL